MEFSLYGWVILPLLIFASRIADVTIGTMRIVFVSKGIKKIAPILGFIEVLIWIIAMKQLMENLNNVITYVAYAGGFAAGNYIGMIIEDKLSIGIIDIRIITPTPSLELVNYLRKKGFGVTTVDAYGKAGKVKIIHTIINKKHMKTVIEAISKYNPKAFYTIEDIKSLKEGVFPMKGVFNEKRLLKIFKPFRKGK